MKFVTYISLLPPVTPIFCGLKYSPQHFVLKHANFCSSPWVGDQFIHPYKTTGDLIVHNNSSTL